MKPLKTRLTVILCISLISALIPHAVAAEAPVTVLIFPFKIHAAEDKAFLQAAVVDMLRTRLSGKGRTILVAGDASGFESLTEESALTAARDNSAGYMLLGSLTLLGQNVSTDARLIRVADQRIQITFSQTGQGQEAAIEHVDALATRVTQEILMLPKAFAPPPQKPEPSSAGAPPHESAPAVNLSYWKSDDFNTEIHSLAIGDVDGDGRNEIIFVDGNNISIYRSVKHKFERVKTISEKSHNEFIRVDTADINANGRAEIFVTNIIHGQKRARSFVLEWNGAEFETLSEKANWYYRALARPQPPKILLGQKGGSWKSMLSVTDALFENGVYAFQWQAGGYVPGIRQNLPNHLIIYGYTTGDISSSTGQEKIVAFSSNNYLTVLNANGDKEWESDQPYGGSTLFFEVPDPRDSQRTENFYLPQRIFIADFDQDGQNEIIVVKNHDAAGALARIKYFNEGIIEGLAYDAIGVQLKWQTRKIFGYISDYTLGDFDNDGQDDLVFSVVSKRKSFLNKGVSAIIVCSVAN